MVFSAAVATIFTIFSIVNSAGSAANIAYEKEIVGESVKTMRETVTQLREKSVYTEKDKLDRKIKSRVAQKLANTADALSGDLYGSTFQSKKIWVHDAAKTTLMEFSGRAAEEYLQTEVSKQAAKTFIKDVVVPVNIATGVVDAAIMAKSAWGADSGLKGDLYGQLATPSENINLDAQIVQIQAQQLVRDSQKTSAELRQMMVDFGIDPDNPEGTGDSDGGKDDLRGAGDDSGSDDSGSDDWGSDDWSDDDWSDDDWSDDDWSDDDWSDDDWSDDGWSDDDWSDDGWSDDGWSDDDYYDDGSYDDGYYDDTSYGELIDPYYDSEEWRQISEGIGFDQLGDDASWDVDVPVGDWGTDDYYGDDYDDGGYWDEELYPPDDAAVDPGYYDDSGMVYPDTVTDYPADTPVVTDTSGSSGSAGTPEPCDPSQALCGLDMDL